jgi:hypothetical protein
MPTWACSFGQRFFDRGRLAQLLNVVSLELVKIRAYNAHSNDILQIVSSFQIEIAITVCSTMSNIIEGLIIPGRSPRE